MLLDNWSVWANCQSLVVCFQLKCKDRASWHVGLFFSLGHSTIVIAVNIALAISVDIYDKLDGEPRSLFKVIHSGYDER